jgi:hypothetical protein
MKPLSGPAKAALAPYRAAQALPAETRQRALAGLHARIAAGAAPPEGVEVRPPEPLSQGIVAKVLAAPLAKIGVGILALAIPAAVLLSRGERSEVVSPGPVPAATQKETEPSRPDTERRETIVHAESAAVTSPSSVPEGSSTAVANTPSPKRATKASAPSAPPAEVIVLAEEAEADTVDEEVALLSRAHAALRAGRPSETLSALSLHARRFPNSKMALDREATRILAICASGQKERARMEADRFLNAHPGSAFTSRLRNVCAD